MTEKAADAETSGAHCLKLFLVVIENLLKANLPLCFIAGPTFVGCAWRGKSQHTQGVIGRPCTSARIIPP
jgi:hypothetical protein